MSYVRNQKYEIESLLRGYYIKYDRLLELNAIINGVSKIQNPESIDIYIDLFDMLKPIYTTDVYANNTFSICASVINLAAHLIGGRSPSSFQNRRNRTGHCCKYLRVIL